MTATLERITGFQLTAADAVGLARFYQEAFGCEAARLESISADELRLLGVSGGGCRIALQARALNGSSCRCSNDPDDGIRTMRMRRI